MSFLKYKITRYRAVYYYLLLTVGSLIIFKYSSPDLLKDLVDFLISILPLIIVLSNVIAGFLKYRKHPEQGPEIRKYYLIHCLLLLLVTFIFYLLYSPISFSPIIEALKKITLLFTAGIFFVFLFYLCLAIIFGAAVFILVKVYQKHKGTYAGSIGNLGRRLLFGIFFSFLFLFGFSFVVFPAAYAPISGYFGGLMYELFPKEDASPYDLLAHKRIMSLKEAVNKTLSNLKSGMGSSQQKLVTTVSDTKKSLDKAIERTNKDITSNLSENIEDSLGLGGQSYTISNDLTIKGDLTVNDRSVLRDVLPASDDSYDLGSISKGWNNLYVHALHGSSIITIGDGSTSHGIANTDDLLLSGRLEANGLVYLDNGADLGGNKIINLADPASAYDAATKNYVDSKIVSLLLGGGGSILASSSNLSLGGVNLANSAISGVTNINGISSAELSYLDGLTSSIQSQIDYAISKAGKTSGGTSLPSGGSSSQYLTGSQAWAALNQAAVAGLTTTDSPTFTGLTLSGLTAGSLLFAGTGGTISQDNSNFYWDNTNDRLGIGTTSPYARLSVAGETVSTYFTATSTTATSTFGNINVIGNLWQNGAAFTGSQWTTSGSNIYYTAGYVGIGTSSPYAKLSVAGEVLAGYFTATSTTDTSTFLGKLIVASSSPFATALFSVGNATTSIIVNNNTGYVGIGTSSPYAMLSVNGETVSSYFTAASSTLTSKILGKLIVASSTPFSHALFSVGGTTPNLFVDNNTGYVGIGTSTPWGRFSVEQGASDTNIFVVGDEGTSTPFLKVDAAGTTHISYLKPNRLDSGAQNFENNAGVVSWIDMTIDASVATGTIESYTAQLGSVSMLTIYGEASGGSVATTSVGIGTTTPFGYLAINASTTKPALNVQQVNSGNQGPIAVFYDGVTEKIRIDTNGNMLIGTTTSVNSSTLIIGTANSKLEISKGGLCVDDDGSCNASTTGRISAVSYITAASDLAENYFSFEPLSAGDVVMAGGGDTIKKAGAADQNSIIGVVSTKPGIIMGMDGDNPNGGEYPVALAGRAPVKVNLEGGEIIIGDPLTISSESGVAKKAEKSGKIIGYALDNFSGAAEENKGQVLMFVDVGYYSQTAIADDADGTADNADNSADIISQSFDWILEQFKNIGLTIKDGIVSAKEFIADKITAKKAVVEELEMKDKATGEIYCVRMENGEMSRVLGVCPEN